MMELAELMAQRRSAEQRLSQAAPLDLEAKRLANQRSSAELPGLIATSESTKLDTDKKRATQDSSIAATNYENRNKTFRTAMTQIGALADDVSQAPGVERHTRLRDGIVNRLGVQGPDADRLMEHFSRFNPEQLPKEMKRIAKALVENDPQYVREMDKERMQQEGADRRQRMSISSQERMEQNRIDAGKYNRGKQAVGIEDQVRKARNAGQAAEILESAAFEALANNDMQAASGYAQRAKAARARYAEDAANRGLARPDVDLSQFGLGTTPSPGSNAPIGPQGATPPASAPAPQGRIRVRDKNGKVGTIPAAQLEQAMKEGYSRIQ